MESGFQARTIDDVITAMDRILSDSITQGTRIGYFAGLYLRVTRSVQHGILAGDVFQDNPRMEQLDVIFANRFFAAWDAWCSGGTPTAPWALAFEALSRDGIMVVQHIGAAMNAHIDLDLGIAAAELMRQRGEPLAALKTDFDMINTVLERLIGIVQVQLSELSQTFSRLEMIAPGLQGRLFGRALDGLRSEAWHLAEALAAQETALGRQLVIAERTLLTGAAGELILHPLIFTDTIQTVAAEEAAHGIRSSIQIVAE